MPLYEFRCKNKKCGQKYEEITAYDETNKYPGVKCPHCGSKRKEKMLSCANFTFAQPVGTDRWNNSHDYRFKHNIPKVQKEREMAQAMSHMGANPYGDTSAADIELDTGVHDAESRPGLS